MNQKNNKEMSDKDRRIFGFILFGLPLLFFVGLLVVVATFENKIIQSNKILYDTCLAYDAPREDAVTNANESLKTPKTYSLAQIRCGALLNRSGDGDETRLYGEKFETAVRIVYESIKIHTTHGEREWMDMCKRIVKELDKEFWGRWNCIASDKPINAWVRSDGHYMMIKLDDLHFEIYRI